MTKLSLRLLVDGAIDAMKEMHYTDGTLRHYRRWWDQFVAFAESESDDSYSVDLSNQFLRSRGIEDIHDKEMTKNQRHFRLAMRTLGEYALHGCVTRRRHRDLLIPFSEHWKAIAESYEHFCGDGRRTPLRCLNNRMLLLRQFCCFLDRRGIVTPREIDAKALEAFVAKQSHVRPRTLASQVSHIRSFLRFLCMKGLVDSALVDDVPKIRYFQQDRIPTVWNANDVAALLGAVDRSSPGGKRNYAILMLAAKLGMRASDIRLLTLDEIDWDEPAIRFCQSKTGVAVDLPLPDSVGEALVDYLRNGRPSSDAREVFLQSNAPYGPIGSRCSFYDMVAKYRRLAGIQLPKESRKGLHALRHALASRMLEAKVPLETIAGTLGHVSEETTRTYLRIDIDSLRAVAFDPEEARHEEVV
ncbi:Tyrosine recombinase XerC [Stieleria bergensis]|uniref:Tyrosine recombinase XerC n=1 Tax=Stieleria bergensis TaxID=2528025 RepID=A0A517T1Z6_9BACT|nr:Tyrosine recombinase XerC [Planctomycetes bacterium SV_7m_r]